MQKTFTENWLLFLPFLFPPPRSIDYSCSLCTNAKQQRWELMNSVSVLFAIGYFYFVIYANVIFLSPKHIRNIYIYICRYYMICTHITPVISVKQYSTVYLARLACTANSKKFSYDFRITSHIHSFGTWWNRWK